MSVPLGFEGKVYRLGTGTRASWGATVDGIASAAAPTGLVEVDNCKDITVPIEDTEADVTTRKNGGWEAVVGSIRKTQVELAMVHDVDDANYIALLKAKLTRQPVALAILSGASDEEGSNGLWADFAVLKLEVGQEIAGAQMDVFTLKPTFSAVPPEFVQIPAAG